MQTAREAGEEEERTGEREGRKVIINVSGLFMALYQPAQRKERGTVSAFKKCLAALFGNVNNLYIREHLCCKEHQARATCAEGFLKDLLEPLLGAAPWICEVGAWSEGLRGHPMGKASLGIQRDLGEDSKPKEKPSVKVRCWAGPPSP